MSNQRTETSPRRTYAGPAFFSFGFRPFFFGAGLWALMSLILWITAISGATGLGLDVGWHFHELLFGFVGAAIVGFLLTAVPNWTGRLPVRGGALAFLFALWIAGRLAWLFEAQLTPVALVIIDCALFLAVFGFVMREIIAGRNWRNLPVAVAVGALLATNLLFHLERMGLDLPAGLGQRLAMAVVIMLISLIGGRIIPSFTQNWFIKTQTPARPVAFNGFDKVVLLVTLAGVTAWAAAPDAVLIGWWIVLVSVLHFVRLARWRGWHERREGLVIILHVGYAWLASALLLIGLGGVDHLPVITGVHALTVGAMTIMILAVMTRATLGHTGRALIADRMTNTLYILANLAAVLRAAASFSDNDLLMMYISALCWTGAFALFLWRYGPMFWRARH